MTDAQKERIKKAGLDPAKFEPKTLTDEERMDMLEDAILEIAEIIGGDA